MIMYRLNFGIFTQVLLIAGLLFLTSCDWLSNPDKDGDFTLSEEELNQLIDTLLIQGLEELGLSDLGGILMDSTEYGNIPDTAAVIDSTDREPKELESQFRSADLSTFFPSILSQGVQGSCTGWASSAIRSYYINKKENNSSTLNQKRFSPAYVYNNIKLDDCDGGSYTAWAAEFLVAHGDVLEKDSPYDEAKCSELDPSLESKAAQYKLRDYKRVSHDIEQFKYWLDKGVPLLVAMDVYDNFTELTSGDDLYGEEDAFSGQYVGGHAIVINGYSDSLNAFQFHNSWGVQWADEGKAWVEYQTTLNLVREVFVVLE